MAHEHVITARARDQEVDRVARNVGGLRMDTIEFWKMLDQLVSRCGVKIDRARGSRHPRYPADIYPLDYGYLRGTRSGDGHGIDVWIGSLPEPAVTAVICTIDLEKRDTEVKLLLGCTTPEALTIVETHRSGSQSAILIERARTGNPERSGA